MSLTDKQIDEMFKKGAENLSFEYKDAYWQEMDAMLTDAGSVPSAEEAPHVDAMFKAKAESMSFTYKPEYWSEMEAMLPAQRRPDFLWFFTSLLFIGLIGFNVINPGIVGQTNDQLALDGNDVDRSIVDWTEEVRETEVFTYQEPLVVDLTGLDFDWPLFSNYQHYQMPTCGGVINVDNFDPMFNGPFMLGTPGVIDGVYIDDKVDELKTRPLEALEQEIQPMPPYEGAAKATSGLYLQAVGGLSQSLITPSDKVSYSYGIGAGYELKKRNFSLTTGANLIVSNHEDLVLNRTAKVYGFGSEVHHFNIDYKKLYILEGNLELGYSIHRHKLKLGIRPSYTFSSKVRVNEFDLTYAQADVFESGDDRELYGFMDGLKRFGVKPMIGYAYSLRPDMELGINIGMQLMPMVNEDYLDGTNNRLPIDGQIYFRKSLRLRR